MTLHITVDVYHHYPEGTPCMPNAALEAQLASISTTLSAKNETISSLSNALGAGGDSTAISSAVSAAVDAEDTLIAGEISTELTPSTSTAVSTSDSASVSSAVSASDSTATGTTISDTTA